MTDIETLDKAHEALDELLQDACEYQGGYPGFVCSRFRGWTMIVELGNDGHKGPRLRFYRNRTMVKWYRKALKYMKWFPELDMTDALHETWPDEDKPNA